MSRPPITTTILDADGAPHQYTIQCHPGEEGEDIMWQLVAMGLAPACDAILRALRAGSGGGLSAVGLSGLLESLDGAALGAQMAPHLLAPSRRALVRAMLVHTTRDGQPLSNPIVRDAAYTANYAELLAALWEVIRANRFLSLWPGMRV